MKARHVAIGAVLAVMGVYAGAEARAALVSVTDTNGTGGANSSPSAEAAPNVRDGNAGTKYLNFAKLGTGFIETFPAAVVANGMNFTTANDAPERDPINFNVYGSNSVVITGTEPAGTNIDFSSFTLINPANQATNLNSVTRGAVTGDQPFTNTTAYRTYAVLFQSVRNSTAANSMQIAEAIFDNGGSAIAGQATNPVVGFPEPASLGVLAVGALGLLARRRKAGC